MFPNSVQAATFSVTYDGPDGPANPVSWASIGAPHYRLGQTGFISGGYHTWTVYYDDQCQIASSSVKILCNHAPVANLGPSIQVYIDHKVLVDAGSYFTEYDSPSGDYITYRPYNITPYFWPTWMTVSADTGIVRGLPTAPQGWVEYRVVGEDRYGAQGIFRFWVYVWNDLDPTINMVPEKLTLRGNQTFWHYLEPRLFIDPEN